MTVHFETRDLTQEDKALYCQLLGIKHDSNQSEIKLAYRKLCLQHHPDKGGDPEKFQQILKAFYSLKDMDIIDDKKQCGNDLGKSYSFPIRRSGSSSNNSGLKSAKSQSILSQKERMIKILKQIDMYRTANLSSTIVNQFVQELIEQEDFKDLMSDKFLLSKNSYLQEKTIKNIGYLCVQDSTAKRYALSIITDQQIRTLLTLCSYFGWTFQQNLDFIYDLSQSSISQDKINPIFSEKISYETFKQVWRLMLTQFGETQIKLMKMANLLLPCKKSFSLYLLAEPQLIDIIMIIERSNNCQLVQRAAYLIGYIANAGNGQNLNASIQQSYKKCPAHYLRLVDDLINQKYFFKKTINLKYNSFLYALQGLAICCQDLRKEIAKQENIQKLIKIAHQSISIDQHIQVEVVSLFKCLFRDDEKAQMQFIQIGGFKQLSQVHKYCQYQKQMNPELIQMLKDFEGNRQAKTQIKNAGFHKLLK